MYILISIILARTAYIFATRFFSQAFEFQNLRIFEQEQKKTVSYFCIIYAAF